jgi:hypothetical protein
MSGSYRLAGTVLLLAILLPIIMTVAGAQGSGSLTRGGTFTVTVIGIPRTAYDIWPKGTSSMTGEPGDQPPIIVPGQTDVVQDSPGGPYVIGSHPTSGGGTILDDVPPTSSVVSAASYYAEVRTDASGHGVVLFQTSRDTATQQFHIGAQNPADLNEDVQVVLGLPPTPKPVLTPIMPLPLPTTMQTPLLPAPTTPVPAPTVEATPAATTATVLAPSPVETAGEATPVQGTPLWYVVSLAAVGLGVFFKGKGL